MTSIDKTIEVSPYKSDADYLTDLHNLMVAQAVRLSAQFEAEHEKDDPRPICSVFTDEDPLDQQTRKLLVAENGLRATFGQRLAATHADGRRVGLEELADEHDLDEVERLVLRLVATAAMSMQFTEVLGGLGRFYFPLTVNPEMIAVFADLDMAGRIKLRRQLGGDSKLVSGGLVEVELPHGEHPADFWTASMYVTLAAFERVVGQDARSTTCGTCGVPLQAACPRR